MSETTSPSPPAVAVLGCGNWGRNLVRNFHQLGALASVCDPTEEGRRLARELVPGAEVVGRSEVALSLPAQGVAIATPAETHYALAKAALLAGKDVFVEKPLALTLSEGEELVRLAGERERILMVGHVLEYHPAIVELVSMVRGGILGDLRYIYSNRLSLGRVRREENILWSFAPHDIAVILRLVDGLPTQVAAAGGAYIQQGIADVTVTNLLFESGVRSHIYVSWLHPFKDQRLVVIGSQRMASFDDVRKELVIYDQRVDVRAGEPVPVRGIGEPVDYDQAEPLALECQAFLDAVVKRRPPLTDGASALRVLQVLEAAQSSLSRDGAPVFLGDRSDQAIASRG